MHSNKTKVFFVRLKTYIISNNLYGYLGSTDRQKGSEILKIFLVLVRPEIFPTNFGPSIPDRYLILYKLLGFDFVKLEKRKLTVGSLFRSRMKVNFSQKITWKKKKKVQSNITSNANSVKMLAN